MNPWAAGTTYSTPGGAFKWGLSDMMPQGLTQPGANAFGRGLQGVGLSMMPQGQGAFGSPGMAFAQGLNNSRQAMKEPEPQSQEGGGGGMYFGGILPGLLGGKFGGGMGGAMGGGFDIKKLFGGMG
jgi:hypothetical protein